MFESVWSQIAKDKKKTKTEKNKRKRKKREERNEPSQLGQPRI
jgi:hypothetical protein